MIIWKGFGFLVAIIAIASVIIGSILGDSLGYPTAGMGAGLLIAAIANWAVWKFTQPKQPRVLIDAATGQQFIDKPSHSLFFIPAHFWTWIFLALSVPFIAVGIDSDLKLRNEAKVPGFAEFTAANKLIDTNSSGTNHGNTPKSKECAAVFSEKLKHLCSETFEGGSKHNAMTGGDFLTYCQESAEAIVFLCHVPELRNYKSEDTKKTLAEAAWMVGAHSADLLDPSHKKKLVIGLRGIANYGFTLEGPIEGALPTINPSPDKAALFYPIFDPAKMSAK